ncbi:MAG: TetR/AcrR family transcriptional regulator [Ruminococcaceae bacterium]|nr:TetR/AcrR family transcriptional regulator [Oscillospiraceae bacterium]
MIKFYNNIVKLDYYAKEQTMDSQEMQFHKEAFDKIPEEKRKRILDAATDEFANYGFENTSIQQIAKRAEISVGSVYKYFENKDELFAMVVKENLTLLEELLLHHSSSNEDVIVKAEKVLKELLKFSKKHPQLIKLYCAITTGNNTEFSRLLAQRVESISAKVYTEVIEKAQSTGDVRKDIDPKFFAFLLDNVFMMLQFSTSCDYYKERFKVYLGEDVENKDDFIIEQTLKFIKAAFK